MNDTNRDRWISMEVRAKMLLDSVEELFENPRDKNLRRKTERAAVELRKLFPKRI